MNKHGVLLINLGTPLRAELSAVKRYLREFLTDKRVIDLPAPLRYLLVYGLILPFRSKKSTQAYQLIWTDEGSPLLTNSQLLVSQLQQISASHEIALGMRYGKPSIFDALERLKHCETITVLPLYPQYSSAATGSSIEEVMRIIMSWEVIPSLNIIRDFYQHSAYIKAQAQTIKNHLKSEDYLLFSYHGIPERQIIKSGCKTVCVGVCSIEKTNNLGCYKAQCHTTSSLLALELKRSVNQYSSSFQSRLGKTPWIKPYTDDVLTDLAAKGIKNLSVVCPSFVVDCLETLEEIGMRAKAQWLALGGEQFTLIPCMNTDKQWLETIVELIKSE